MLTDRPVLSFVKAAAKCGVTRRTVYHWYRNGWIECVCLPSGRLLVYEDTLLKAATAYVPQPRRMKAQQDYARSVGQLKRAGVVK